MYIDIKFCPLYVPINYISYINAFILALSHTDAFLQHNTTASYTLPLQFYQVIFASWWGTLKPHYCRQKILEIKHVKKCIFNQNVNVSSFSQLIISQIIIFRIYQNMYQEYSKKISKIEYQNIIHTLNMTHQSC